MTTAGDTIAVHEASEMPPEMKRDLDILWTLVGAYLVFFMQCGFSMLEAGTVRKQNTVNILLKNLLDSCVAALVWWAVGYPLAFGEGNENVRRFIGGSNFFMADIETSANPEFYSQWIFQWAFAATSATIVSGAAAERCRYQAYAVYTVVITGFVYPVVVHWVWSDEGWLSAFNKDRTFEGTLGLIDFAGSSVVHVTGGGAAFFAAWFLGPRLGRFDPNTNPEDFRASDQSLIMLGSFILWFGWYAFNSASGACVENCMVTASLAAVNTTLSAAAGSTTVLVIHSLQGHRIQIAPGLNGLLAGLVGITAGCAVVAPFAAVIIGFLSGAAYYGGASLLRQMRIDDPLESSAVHFSAGFVGTVAVGLFATEANLQRAYAGNFNSGMDFGLFYGGGIRQLFVQILGALLISFWTCSISCILFFILDLRGVLRVGKEEEIKGLDASIHGIAEKPLTDYTPHDQRHHHHRFSSENYKADITVRHE